MTRVVYERRPPHKGFCNYMTIHMKAKEINWVSVAEKAISTGIQSGLALLVVGDMSSVELALASGLAAGLAVLKNAVKEWRNLVEKI